MSFKQYKPIRNFNFTLLDASAGGITEVQDMEGSGVG